ncbi:hypothetical protein KSP39_PZI008333 [Platanthera zijinensis]|uniref:Uncharacterized protein n=1 Tax=Platanthera zijinensis TaxID=2320716 RepID=A0AAP0BM24_9ASPA
MSLLPTPPSSRSSTPPITNSSLPVTLPLGQERSGMQRCEKFFERLVKTWVACRCYPRSPQAGAQRLP